MNSTEQLLTALAPLATFGSRTFEWSGIASDSRRVTGGDIFFAIPGANHDGTRYISQAIDCGASALVVPESYYNTVLQYITTTIAHCELPLIAVADVRQALARAAALLYNYPSRELCCIGITGTNGKTSTAWLVAQLVSALGESCLLCGTLGIALVTPSDPLPTFDVSANTTADPLTLQQKLREAADAGARYAVIEVTSQGIAQRRTCEIDWDICAFTNLTRDHLDLHDTLEQYTALKYSLFSEQLADSKKETVAALLNTDDPVGGQFLADLSSSAPSIPCYSMTVKNSTTSATVYSAKNVSSSVEGIAFSFCIAGDEITLRSSLMGSYNVSNLLSALSILHLRGYSPSQLAEVTPKLLSVPGRLERVGSGDVFVFVDYAHTPDALENVLDSIRPIAKHRLICVFGCGGDRDRGKRPLMAQAVAQRADYAILTSDNPRTENPEQIIADTVKGFTEEAITATNSKDNFSWTSITDRREAIAHAVQIANPGDVLIVAGKGHEDYQDIQGHKYPFLDRSVCEEALAAVGKL